jgi:hypothetical protein
MTRQTSVQLSQREREVWGLAQSGYRPKSIARALNISPSTVGAHLQKVRLKIKEGNMTEPASPTYHATATRKPIEADADAWGSVQFWNGTAKCWMHLNWRIVARNPEIYRYWAPCLPNPETAHA